MFTYDAPVPAAVVAGWQDRLEALTPRSERMGWLRVRWFAGFPWAPVQRWVIEEMIPEPLLRTLARDAERDGRRLVYAIRLESLNGAHPHHRFDAADGRVRRGDSMPCTVHEWETWRAERCWAQTVWVVQGPYGGHKRWYDDLDRRVCQMAALPGEPPVPGSLPYAEPSEQTFNRLAGYDRMRQAQQDLKQIQNGRALRLARERLMASILRDIYGQVEAIYQSTRSLQDLDAVPRTGDGIDYAAWERAEASFLTN